MKDKVIRCQDCCNNFVFTVKQQKSYAERGWTAPIRCPSCRARKRPKGVFLWQKTKRDFSIGW